MKFEFKKKFIKLQICLFKLNQGNQGKGWLGPILRGNTPKHADKHTKRAGKHTIYHLSNWCQIYQTKGGHGDGGHGCFGVVVLGIYGWESMCGT